MKQKKLNKAFEVIKEVILELNPANLIKSGINDYELDNEIKAIAKIHDRVKSPKDAILIIKKIFASSMSLEVDHELIGNKIFEKLKENELL